MGNISSKNSLLFVAIIGVGLFIVLIFSRPIGLCPSYSFSNCARFTDSMAEIMIPIIPFFLFSLTTYFLRDEVFKLWIKFAIPGVLVSMLLIFITPESTGGGFGPQIAIGKGDTALVTSVFFIIISIFIIGIKQLMLWLRR